MAMVLNLRETEEINFSISWRKFLDTLEVFLMRIEIDLYSCMKCNYVILYNSFSIGTRKEHFSKGVRRHLVSNF